MEARSLSFVAPRTVEVEREEIPSPAVDEVLVRSERSLVSSGTELLIYRGEAPPGLEADTALDTLDGDLSFPLKYGYAVVGEVAEIGASVPPTWEGRTVFAFNPHESHFTIGADELYPVPAGISAEAATFVPLTETAVNLVLDGAPRIGERVVVFGAGLVGLLSVSALAEFPLEQLTVVEPIATRREHALRLGADEAVAPAALAADGDADVAFDDVGAPDLIYELSGSPDALDDAVELAGYGGRVVVGSWYGRKRADLDLGGHFHRERLSISSSQVSTIAPELRGRWDKDRRMEVTWRRLRSVPVCDLLTHRFPIARAGRAYDLLDSAPEDALGVAFTYE